MLKLRLIPFENLKNEMAKMKDLGYADLNIPSKPESTVKARVVRALELGYQTVAINTVIHQVRTFLFQDRRSSIKRSVRMSLCLS